MSDDVLTLGGIAFDDFSTPHLMGAGGRQQMVIHKLPGGGRVVDLLGPDESDIPWSGEFFSDDAYDKVLALDAMRMSGQVVPLTFAGQFRSVVIEHFEYRIKRLPTWIEYRINCVVDVNPAMGAVGVATGSIDSLILSDLSMAMGLL